MSDKYFKKIYSDRTAYGKCMEGDGINYNEQEKGKNRVEFKTKTKYIAQSKMVEFFYCPIGCPPTQKKTLFSSLSGIFI